MLLGFYPVCRSNFQTVFRLQLKPDSLTVRGNAQNPSVLCFCRFRENETEM